MPPSPIRPTDDAARALARSLIAEARFAALAVAAPDADTSPGAIPLISRVALLMGHDGCPTTLVSTLSAHTGALRRAGQGALLIGEPGPRGDPLTHPRLSLRTRAQFVPRDTPEHATLRAHWLRHRPKSALYIDFADFGFCRFTPLGGSLNGGFGQAFDLTATDLTVPGPDR